MNTQLYLARGIIDGRGNAGREHAQQRAAELALESDRAARRAARRTRRRG